MSLLRKFVSLAVMGAIAIFPLLATGCADNSGGTSTSKSSTATVEQKPAENKDATSKPKAKKKKKKESTGETASTEGGGVKTPIK
jgi:hypothetical protein